VKDVKKSRKNPHNPGLGSSLALIGENQGEWLVVACIFCGWAQGYPMGGLGGERGGFFTRMVSGLASALESFAEGEGPRQVS